MATDDEHLSINSRISNAIVSLKKAEEYLSRCVLMTVKAQEEETRARVAMINEQRNFDSLVFMVKEDAPAGTLWTVKEG